MARAPILYLMVGLPGVGKTQYARSLEIENHAVRLSPDEWMSALFGESETSSRPDRGENESAARREDAESDLAGGHHSGTGPAKTIGGEADPAGARNIIEAGLITIAHRVLSLGVSAILDFGLWEKDERTALRSLAYTMGAKCELHYLPFDEPTHQRWIRQRLATHPDETVESSEAFLAEERSRFQVPDASEVGKENIDTPPAGFASWAKWAATRWPSLPIF